MGPSCVGFRFYYSVYESLKAINNIVLIIRFKLELFLNDAHMVL